MLEHVERHAELLSRTSIRKIGDELQPSRKEISISRVQLHLQWIHCTTRVVDSNIVAAGHSRADLGPVQPIAEEPAKPSIAHRPHRKPSYATGRTDQPRVGNTVPRPT